MAMWLILLGAPGSGKGTQVEYLTQEKGFSVVSVGDILRQNLNTPVLDSEKTVGEIIGSGLLLPDECVISLVNETLAKLVEAGSQNMLFDGFPRTVGQALAMSALMEDFGNPECKVLNFVVDEDIVFKRILGRYKCSKCGKIYNKFFLKTKVDEVCDICGSTEFESRSDDNEDSLRQRLLEYHDKTYPLIDFYSKNGLLYNLDADQSFERVKESVLKVVDL